MYNGRLQSPPGNLYFQLIPFLTSPHRYYPEQTKLNAIVIPPEHSSQITDEVAHLAKNL